MTDRPPDPTHPVANELIGRFLSAIVREKDDARSSILLAHGVVELFVNAVVDAHCKNAKKITSDSRGYPHSTRLVILHEMGIVSEGEFDLLDWFRKLRNRAAHDPLFELRPEDLQRFKPNYRTPEKINEVCIDIVGGFWNVHLYDLLPKFAPSLNEPFLEMRRRREAGEKE